jgi:hypothetical protein
MRLARLVGLVLLVLGCNIASVSLVSTTPAPTTTLVPTPTSLPTQTPEPTEQALTCNEVITAALASVGPICDATERNEACYGSNLVSAELLPGAQAKFEEVGDLTSLYNLRQISTAPWDDEQQTWGVALLKAQVNLPDNLPGQNVTFLLYGGATLDGLTPRMEAVILKTGIGGSTCADAPESAALVQAPLGSVVTLNINGADLIVGSTLHLTAVENEEMSIGTIDGTVIVDAMGGTEIISEGAQVKMPLGDDEDGFKVVGPPSEPEPFDLDLIEAAPLELLPESVDIPEPITVEPTLEESPTDEPTETATVTLTRTPTRTLTPPVSCFPRTDWEFRYTVAPGDTLSSIAQRAGISVTQLQVGNCITNVNQIFVGQVLRVPVRLISTDTPTPTPTGSATATNTPVSPTPSDTPTNTPTPTPTDTPTSTFTPSHTPTLSPTPTFTWTPTHTPTASSTPVPLTVPTICLPPCGGGGVTLVPVG